MTTITADDARKIRTSELAQPARRPFRRAGVREHTSLAAAQRRRTRRPVAVVALVLASALIFGAVRAFTSVTAAATPAHDAPAYFIVMPHPASEENQRVARWLARQLHCSVVEDASVHEVGIREGAK